MYCTQLPPIYLFEGLTPNESLFYSVFLHYKSLDPTIQTLANHLSRTTINTIKHTLIRKQFITKALYIKVNPIDLPNPPIDSSVTITSKMGRPKKPIPVYEC